MTIPDVDTGPVAAVRGFNRFYTNVIGVLHGGLLDSPYTLTEARVLFELAGGGISEVAELRRVLDIDAGYLSRILARFEADQLITRERSASDGRRQVIGVTGAGQAAFAELSRRQDEQVGELLAGLDDDARERLLAAMTVVQDTLAGTGARERDRKSVV